MTFTITWFELAFMIWIQSFGSDVAKGAKRVARLLLSVPNIILSIASCKSVQ